MPAGKILYGEWFDKIKRQQSSVQGRVRKEGAEYIIIVTLSAKSSLILGEYKAGFCRKGHIYVTVNA